MGKILCSSSMNDFSAGQLRSWSTGCFSAPSMYLLYCTIYSIRHCANPLKVHEPATDSQDPHLPSTATHEVGEEKPVEITDSEFTATKNVSIKNSKELCTIIGSLTMSSFSNLQVDEKEIRDVPKLPDKAPPEQELEELKDQTTVTGEEQTSRESEVEQETKQQEPVPDAQPQRSEDTPTTTQSTPTEVTVIVCN